MALINQPPNNPVDDGSQVNQGWATFFNTVFQLLAALTQSGTTANRPTKMLWVGRTYFDTTLTRPIWYTGTNWIKADGTVV
jgi:hypothetical protein